MLENDLWRRYIRPLRPIPTGLERRGKPTGQLNCMVFDIYGTLLISGSGDVGSSKITGREMKQLGELLKSYRIPQSPQQLLDALFSAIEIEHRNMKRSGIDYPEVDIMRIWRSLLASVNLESLPAFAMQFELIINPVYPMPHLQELLSVCRRADIKMGIISNAQFYTPIIMEFFLNRSLSSIGFDPGLTVFSYLEGRAKPSLDLFEKVGVFLDHYHIPRSTALYIGNDMLNDIKPAEEVGFQTALYAGDARSLRMRSDDMRCRGISANMIVTDLHRLVDLVEQHTNIDNEMGG